MEPSSVFNKRYRKSTVVKNIVEKGETNSETPNRAINGSRYNRHYILSEDEIEMIKREADLIEIPVYDNEDLLVFNEHSRTAYHGDFGEDFISIAGDIFPDENSNHPTDLLSIKAVLAHEYYGHREFKNTLLPNDWMDECRASYNAALVAPGLSELERETLIKDAINRIPSNLKWVNVHDILDICEKEENLWKLKKKLSSPEK